MFRKLIQWLYLHQKNNLAYFDVSLGIHNRNYYERVLKKKYRNKAVVIAIIDLNDLKKINDTEGHMCGDIILQNLSKVLQTSPGCLDCVRYGGDEFVMFHDGSVNLKDILENFASVWNKSFSFGEYNKKKTDDITYALTKADKTMYYFKRKGKSE